MTILFRRIMKVATSCGISALLGHKKILVTLKSLIPATAHCSLPTAHWPLIMRQVQPFDPSRAPGLLIYIQNSAANSRLGGGMFGSLGNRRGETRDYVLLVHANYAGVASRHSQ